jgi:hypothetical protein
MGRRVVVDGVARGAVVAGGASKAVTRMRGQSDILAKAAPPMFSDDDVVVRIHREEGLRSMWARRGVRCRRRGVQEQSILGGSVVRTRRRAHDLQVIGKVSSRVEIRISDLTFSSGTPFHNYL